MKILGIKKSTREKFIRAGGYKLVNRDPVSGKLIGMNKAVQASGLKKPTIIRIMRQYPEEKETALPKYYAKFEESELYQKLKDTTKDNPRRFRQYKNAIIEAWLLLNQTDPAGWGPEQYQILWDKWRQPDGFVEYGHGTAFRAIMYLYSDKLWMLKDKRFKTHRKGGEKKSWYLDEESITKMIEIAPSRPLLIWFMLGINTASRGSAFVNPYPETKEYSLVPNRMNLSVNSLQVFEQKIKAMVTKPLHPKMTVLLKKYIADYNFGPLDPIFPKSLNNYKVNLEIWGRNAHTMQKVTSHILKHTAVMQMAEHGTPLDVVSDIAHTEERTLKEFYGYKREESARIHIQGIGTPPEPFHVFFSRIADQAIKRYDTLSARALN